MPVVSNTSPLIGLSAIGHLDLLRDQFGEVAAPSAVLAECRLETDFRGAKAIRDAQKAGWLQEKQVNNTDLVRALAIELDLGESEAIALALENESAYVLMDEQDGRAKARAMGLMPVGIVGVLLRAKLDGRLPSLTKALQQLKDEAGFFISDELTQKILAQAGE